MPNVEPTINIENTVASVTVKHEIELSSVVKDRERYFIHGFRA